MEYVGADEEVERWAGGTVEVGARGAHGELAGNGGIIEEGVDGVDGEELAEGVGEPEFGGKVGGPDTLGMGVQCGREGNHQVRDEGGE